MKSNTDFRPRLMRSMLLRCFIAAVSSAFILFAGYYLAQYVAHWFTWYPGPLYDVLKTIENYSPLVLISVWLVVMCIIIFRYWNKTVKYMEEIVEASKSLITPEDAPIHVPKSLLVDRIARCGLLQLLAEEWPHIEVRA